MPARPAQARGAPRSILRSATPAPMVRLERKRDWHAQIASGFRSATTGGPHLPTPAPPDFSNPFSHRATLNVSGHAYSDAELPDLIDAAWPSLRTLHLGENQLTDQGVETLVATFPHRLTSLLLNDNPLGSMGMAKLSSAPWGHLRRLDLSRCNLGDFGLQLLIASLPPQLRELRLAGNGLQAASMRRLAQGPFRSLTLLDVGHNPANEAGVQALLEAPWPQLQSLDLSYLAADEPYLHLLVQATLPALMRLDISGVPVHGRDAKAFVRRFSQRLVALTLRDCALRGDHVAALFVEAWPALLSLDLDSNRLGTRGLQRLLDANARRCLPHLVRLVVPLHDRPGYADWPVGRQLWNAAFRRYQNKREELGQALHFAHERAPTTPPGRQPPPLRRETSVHRPPLLRGGSSQRTVTLELRPVHIAD